MINDKEANNRKIKAVEEYVRERESCLNPDRTHYVVKGTEVIAFLNGWDYAIKYMISSRK